MPRLCTSNSSINCIARTFGAPVMLPIGKLAFSTSPQVFSLAKVAVTVLISWCTVGKVCTPKSSGTCTLALEATRLRSLRTKSTIITFSARSFTDSCRCFLICSSSVGLLLLRAVPFIGCDMSSSPSFCR